MDHLSLEELARLVDETGNASEREHLESCEGCARELAELRRQSAGLAALPRLQPRIDAWAALEGRLVHAGLITRPGRVPAWRLPPLLRVAAAVLLFAGGAVVGGTLRPAPAADPPGVAAAGVGDGTVEQAQETLRAAEDAYLAALVRYAELTDAGGAPDPMTRLMALESIVLASRAALQQAPADPVINGYYITAVGERQRVMRQLVVDSGDPWF